MIAGVIFLIIQLVQGFIDYRECKSLVDEILKLLNLAPQPQVYRYLLSLWQLVHY